MGANNGLAERIELCANGGVATGSSTGATLSLATVNSDNTAFALNRAGITSRLGQSANAAFHILSGVEVRSSGNLTLGADWNLINSRAGAEPGVLTLRAAGSLLLNSPHAGGQGLHARLALKAPSTDSLTG